MNAKRLSLTFLLPAVLAAQIPNPLPGDRELPPRAHPPLYRVNVVDSSTVAISYGDRGAPTRIGFEGTVLMPQANGEAQVRSRKGNTEIAVKVRKLLAPSRFGNQYLTYVLWAVTPNGRASNLGQLITDHKDRAELKTATEFQTFALIVTAEPYHSVAQPGNVVVMENRPNPGTVAHVEHVSLRSELLRRGEFTWELPNSTPESQEKKVSLDEYEALVELYQARNALNFATAAGAATHAPVVFAAARKALENADRSYRSRDLDRVVTAAREATQAAEDARIIAIRAQNGSQAGQSGPSASATRN